MTQISLLLYTKFHLFWMKYEKDIAFDITPFEKNQTNLHIACLVTAPLIHRIITWNIKNDTNLCQCNFLYKPVKNFALKVPVIFF